jgi:hypothetical protein
MFVENESKKGFKPCRGDMFMKTVLMCSSVRGMVSCPKIVDKN